MTRDRDAFREAVSSLPREMRVILLAMPERSRLQCEELRLRAGRGLTWMARGREYPVELDGRPVTVTQDDLRLVLEHATQASFHAALEKLCRGFLPLKGGHRLGVSGTAVVREGEIINLRDISSIALRVARPQTGIANSLLPDMMEDGRVLNTLILSPPGAGKTTLLRDIIRGLGADFQIRTGVADERGELAALWRGVPQFDLGPCADVMDGCPKAAGLLLLLRSMNPQVLAADEITAPEDVDAILQAMGCGAAIIATAHGSSIEDLSHRPMYRQLLEQNVFSRVIQIEAEESGRRYLPAVLA